MFFLVLEFYERPLDPLSSVFKWVLISSLTGALVVTTGELVTSDLTTLEKEMYRSIKVRTMNKSKSLRV